MQIVCPPLGWTREATLKQWLKENGDWVTPGTPLCKLSLGGTPRTLLAWDSGFLLWANYSPALGALVARGQRLAIIVAPGDSAEQLAGIIPALPQRQPTSAATQIEALADVAAATRPERLRISPRARRLAQESGVDLKRLHGWGHARRIVARDVAMAAFAGPRFSAPAAPLVRPCYASTVLGLAEQNRRPRTSTAAREELDVDRLLRTIWEAMRSDLGGHTVDASSFAFGWLGSGGWQYTSLPNGQPLSRNLLRKQESVAAIPSSTAFLILDLTDSGIDFYLPATEGAIRAVAVICRVCSDELRDEPADLYRVTLSVDDRSLTSLHAIRCLQKVRDMIS
jgi:hypothetical protein